MKISYQNIRIHFSQRGHVNQFDCRKIIIWECYLIIISLVLGCKEIDPVGYADYYVSNETNKLIYLEAFCDYLTYQSKVELMQNEILPAEKQHIYTFIEGSGGHLMPSNAFSDFRVYHLENDSINIIYRGINNNDWLTEGVTKDHHQIFTLIIR